MSSNWLPLIADAIPADLRGLGWVLWRAEDRGEGKPTKAPYCVADPSRKASSTDPSTWATFVAACEASAAVSDVAGIGVVLSMAAGISCIVLDHVLVGRELDVRAQTILERCDLIAVLRNRGATATDLGAAELVILRSVRPRLELVIEVSACARPRVAG
jgi:hypothetical protein